MQRLFTAVLVAVLATTATGTGTEDELLLRKDDRVVFYGDSITEQRLYTRYVQQYVYLRYPELNVRFFNAGWGGDTAKGANARLERDVLELDPTVVTLCFGMNDGRYRAKDEEIAKRFGNELDALVSTLVSRGVRVLVASPGCVDGDRRPALDDVSYNETLANLGRVAKRVAKAHDCRFVDLHAPMLRVQKEMKKARADFTMIPDSVHPAPAGHLVMATELLKGLGVERMPPLGTWTATEDEISVETVLPTPFWIDSGGAGVARACGLIDDLTGQKLTVSGLRKGRYDVAVDGRPLGTYDAAELGRGVAISGSSSARARRMHDTIKDMEDAYFDLWRRRRLPSLAQRHAPAIEERIRSVLAARMAVIDAQHALLIAWTQGPPPQRLTVVRVPEGPNLALGKAYESSDPNPHEWGLGGLTDGSWTADAQDCFATGASAAYPKHVTVDLGRAHRVGVIRFGVPEFGSTKTVRVSVSIDGKRFTDVGNHVFAQRASERQTLRFKGRPARYVRLTYEDHHAARAGYPPTFAFTTELEVYAP